MKKSILIIFVLTVTVLSMHAQGTLQFNKVKLVTTVETVPTGKVWKITNYMPNGATADTGISISGWGTTNYWARMIKVNGNNVFADYAFMAYNSSIQYPTPNSLLSGGPLWLPAGTTLAAHSGIYAISVIEFNIIP